MCAFSKDKRIGKSIEHCAADPESCIHQSGFKLVAGRWLFEILLCDSGKIKFIK